MKLSPQCKRILDLLEQGNYWYSGSEIFEKTGVIKYSTRISDLRVIYGHNILVKYKDRQYWYKLENWIMWNR